MKCSTISITISLFQNYFNNSINQSTSLVFIDTNNTTKDENPFISVIIPCYGKSEYLERAFKSCIDDQQLKRHQFNIEIICVDDGSKDNTYEVFCSLKKKYETINIETNTPFEEDDQNPFKNNVNIKIFKNERNKGALYSKQFAIKQASGYYIMSLDADDEIIPNFMHRLQLLLKNRNDIDIIQFRLAVVNNTIEQKYLKAINSTRKNYKYKVFTYAKYPFKIKKSINFTTPIQKAKYSLSENYINQTKSNDIDEIDHAFLFDRKSLKKMSRRFYLMWNLPGLIIKRKIVTKAIDSINFNYNSIKISLFEDMLISYASYFFSEKIYFLDEVGYIYFKVNNKFKRINQGQLVLSLLSRLYRTRR